MRNVTVAMLVLVTVVLLSGCARPAVNTRVPPLAYIDSVAPSEVYVGEKIKFAGHAVSNVGQIVTYNWRSNVNGDLSQLATFDTNMLTAGPHTIWFKAQDSYGNWSQEISANVNVLTQGGPAKMTIRSFSASPPNINEGDWTTLAWDVKGAGSVRIDPDIGDVPQSGSRSVQPLLTKTYTIYGTNELGIVKGAVVVPVTPIPLNTLTLFSIADEDGTIQGDRVTFDQVYVGVTELQQAMQGFLSFDISSIPPKSIIKTVELDCTAAHMIGNPFPWLGALLIYNQSYGFRIDDTGTQIYLPNTPMFRWDGQGTQKPDVLFSSPDMVKAVQAQVDTRSKRFQVKLQMEKYYYYPTPYPWPYYRDNKYDTGSRHANYMDVGSGTSRLIVRYIAP